MGFFDFFTKAYEENPKKGKTDETQKKTAFQRVASGENASDTFKPNSFEDLKKFIEYLKVGKTIIVDCSHLKESTAIRVLDILSGATYALSGHWAVISQEIFMFVPDGKAVNGQF